MWRRLKSWATRLKREIHALGLAARDPRTPRLARWLAVGVVAYALSPIDLIPDFIPLLGFLDDVILLPLGLWIVLRLIPDEVMQDCRTRAAQEASLERSQRAAVFVICVWLLIVGWLAWLLAKNATS